MQRFPSPIYSRTVLIDKGTETESTFVKYIRINYNLCRAGHIRQPAWSNTKPGNTRKINESNSYLGKDFPSHLLFVLPSLEATKTGSDK